MGLSYSGVVLEKVCEYLCYNFRNSGQSNVPDMDVPPELCLELLMAADYLDGNSSTLYSFLQSILYSLLIFLATPERVRLYTVLLLTMFCSLMAFYPSSLWKTRRHL